MLSQPQIGQIGRVSTNFNIFELLARNAVVVLISLVPRQIDLCISKAYGGCSSKDRDCLIATMRYDPAL